MEVDSNELLREQGKYQIRVEIKIILGRRTIIQSPLHQDCRGTKMCSNKNVVYSTQSLF